MERQTAEYGTEHQEGMKVTSISVRLAVTGAVRGVHRYPYARSHRCIRATTAAASATSAANFSTAAETDETRWKMDQVCLARLLTTPGAALFNAASPAFRRVAEAPENGYFGIFRLHGSSIAPNNVPKSQHSVRSFTGPQNTLSPKPQTLNLKP